MGCGIKILIWQQPLGEPSAKDQDDAVLAREEVDTAVTGDGAKREVVRRG